MHDYDDKSAFCGGCVCAIELFFHKILSHITNYKKGAWQSQRPLGRPAVLSQSQVLKDYFVSNTAQGNGNYILRQSSP